jgi:hypothetical protein
METMPDDDAVEPSEETGIDGPEPGFGEQDEAAQEQEWAEDAEEGGASQH